jgi:peroxiredoxin Q/BCP
MSRLLHCSLAVACLLVLASGPSQAQKGDVGLPEVDKPAPAFDLPATQIGKVLPAKKDATKLNLKELHGKNVVLFFFPRAMTKGCTIESCGFRDRLEKFTDANTVVIGISNDTLEKQEEFTKKEKLNFPLLADTDKRVTKAYGSLSARGFPARHTFVIDRKGVLRKVYTTVSPDKHPDEVLDYIHSELNKK